MGCQEIRPDLRATVARRAPPPTQNKRAETARSPLSCHICVKIFLFSIGKYNYMCYYMIVKRKYL